jgi:zinc and cadmium transporter
MRLTHTRLQIAVSFVAGLMLGMGVLHFIPHAFHQNHSVDRTVQWVVGGFIVMFFLQRFFPHHHHDVSEGAPEISCPAAGKLSPHSLPHCGEPPIPTLAEQSARHLSWAATTVGMVLHSLVGGVALASAVASEAGEHTGTVGLGTALVIILHKPFDALAVSTLMATSGCSRAARHWINGWFALVTPLGALVFYAGASHFASANPAFLGGALAFCAGTFICIACAGLLPELQFHSHDRGKLSLALLAGIGVAVAVGQFEHAGHDHHHAPVPIISIPAVTK